MRRVTVVVGVVLVIWGAWLVVPRRSHAFAELQSSCLLASGAVVRLFRGDVGFGHGWSFAVFVQTGGPWTEEMIFYSYSKPAIRDVRCAGSSLEIVGYEQTWKLDTAAGSGTLVTALRDQVGSYRGRDGLSPSDKTRIIFGALVLVVGFVTILRSELRRRRAAQLAVAAGGATPRR
jgi:hypothetical protein